MAFPSTTQGVLSATPLIFIIPSACFLKLSTGRWFQVENLVPTVLILTGFFVMITGLIMTGLYPQDCSHGVEMFYCDDANISVTVPPVWNIHQIFNCLKLFNAYTTWKQCLWTPLLTHFYVWASASLVPIKGNLNITTCNHILKNVVFTMLWQQFGLSTWQSLVHKKMFYHVWCKRTCLACTEPWPQPC